MGYFIGMTGSQVRVLPEPSGDVAQLVEHVITLGDFLFRTDFDFAGSEDKGYFVPLNESV